MPATVYLGAADAAIGRDQDAIGAWNTAMLQESRSPVVSLLLADALALVGLETLSGEKLADES